MQRITDNIYAVPGMSVGRIFVIAGQNGLALVDTSLAARTPQRLEPQLRQQGYQLTDIQHILITHAHPDHLGGLAEFQRLTPARTYVHRRDALIVRGEAVSQRPRTENLGLVERLMTTFGLTMRLPDPARVDVELSGGAVLDEILPGLQVIETPGHSAGHVGFWWPEKRLFFGGDVLLRMPWGLTLPVAAFTPDMAEAKRSIRKVADLNVDILCLSHGAPFIGNAAAVVRAFAEKLGV